MNAFINQLHHFHDANDELKTTSLRHQGSAFVHEIFLDPLN